jgi:hypothetical protein
MTQDDTFKQIAEYWNQAMPFNKLLGLEITQFNALESVTQNKKFYMAALPHQRLI